MAIASANQHANSPQEPDPLSQIRRHESLDSYARLQSLISSTTYYFSVLIEAKICLDNLRSQVVPSERMASQHLTEPHSTTYDIDESVFDASNTHSTSFELGGFSFPSWRETGLPGHENLSLDNANAQHGSLGHLDYLSRDALEGDMVDRVYESSEDDSEDILERLQESEWLSREDEARNMIGDFKCSCILDFLLSIIL